MEVEFSFSSEKKHSRWKIFWLCFFVIFLIVALQHTNIRTSKLFSPLPAKANIMDLIRPKLQTKPSSFRLQKRTQLISQSFASAPFDEAVAYGVIDFDTGEVLAEKNLATKLSIASLTKVMTAIVALDLAKPTDVITVTKRASKAAPSKIMLKPGEKIPLRDLLAATLLSSANDAAKAIQDGIDVTYGELVFINAMNEKSRMLGLKNTHFTNPQGFDNLNHFSSVEDLAILTHYAMQNYPPLAELVGKDFADITARHDKRFYLNNWNGLLGVYPGVQGVKIGNTEAAGKTTIVVATREGKGMLVLLLGAPGIVERDLWAAQLLDLGFEKSISLAPVAITKEQLRAKYKTWRYF
ncbi:MAG: D-alanyl-D-alanine carboxypeptidase [Candidatus Levybacteria bacterium]|nr:D-alanyl-D-alanine carboxypeptidase [Candidatus Levybacteria bacterium]